MPKVYTRDQLIVGSATCRCGAPLVCPADMVEGHPHDGAAAWSCQKRWLDPAGFAKDYLDDKGQPTGAMPHDPAYPAASFPHFGTLPKQDGG